MRLPRVSRPRGPGRGKASEPRITGSPAPTLRDHRPLPTSTLNAPTPTRPEKGRSNFPKRIGRNTRELRETISRDTRRTGVEEIRSACFPQRGSRTGTAQAKRKEGLRTGNLDDSVSDAGGPSGLSSQASHWPSRQGSGSPPRPPTVPLRS